MPILLLSIRKAASVPLSRSTDDGIECSNEFYSLLRYNAVAKCNHQYFRQKKNLTIVQISSIAAQIQNPHNESTQLK